MHDQRFRESARAVTPPRTSIEEAPPAVPGRSVAPSSGAPLGADIRTRMEASFGMDLSAVRVHEGEQAGAEGAVAYAQGADLHFAPGRYDPHSERGLALLGHELAHVAQHAEGRAPGRQAYGAGGEPALEAEADAMGERAARGERARPDGAPALIARRDPAGAIQRMIDKAAPTNASTWEEIERYLTRTLVNPRKQTFEEAVKEFIQAGLGDAKTVGEAWAALVAALRAKEGDEKRDVKVALQHIERIRTTINETKCDKPDHPNKRDISPEHELYETIPQSELSQNIAFSLRKMLQKKLLEPVVTGTYSDSKKVKIVRYTDPKDRQQKKVIGPWTDSFMLGVLVLPDGSIQVAHSGFMGKSQDAAFRYIVSTFGDAKCTPVTHLDTYSALQQRYKKDTQDELKGLKGKGPKIANDGRGKAKVKHGREWGNPIGVCAAPQVLDTGRSLDGQFPAELTGDTQMALTEVWVSTKSDSKVSVPDAKGKRHMYSGDHDVPSCLTCQVQLRAVMRKLVDLRRNVVNRERVRGEEMARDRYQLVDAVEKLRDILGKDTARDLMVQRITGGEKQTSERTDDDLGKLDALLRAYQKAIDQQAIERTKHPEHVEHDDKSKSSDLEQLVKAETDTRTHHYGALWQKRLEVGRMLQPDVARVGSSDERVQTPGKKTLPFTKRGKLSESPKELRERAYFVNAREKHALEALRDAQQSSEVREELERLQVAEEAQVLARASQGLQKLAYYQESGYLLGDEAEEIEVALRTHTEKYREATGKILAAKPSDESLARHHDQLATAMRGLATAVHELDYRLGIGEERVRTQRSDEAELAAKTSSKRREQSEAKYADQLYGLAMSLARMYDTSLERELQRLVEEDQGIAPPTPEDHSDQYIG